jgi:hypothetical protein
MSFGMPNNDYADPHQIPLRLASKAVCRTANASRSTVKDMGIGHRGFDIIIGQEFLHPSYIVTTFEQGVAKEYQEVTSNQFKIKCRLIGTF